MYDRSTQKLAAGPSRRRMSLVGQLDSAAHKRSAFRHASCDVALRHLPHLLENPSCKCASLGAQIN